MITSEMRREFYQALVEKRPEYDGVFYVGVRTTGVFCRSICPARKPKFENCEFFETAQQALLASYRPCKRCRPLSHPNQVSPLIQMLVEAVEQNPEKRWRNKDFQQLSVDASTARRQFKKRFGMTFVEYARARRMGLAMQQIRAGEPVIEAQLSTGYESSSGFRDAFSRIMGAAPTRARERHLLNAAWLDTRLGPMLAIADEEFLYLQEFVDRRGLEREIERLRQRAKLPIVPGHPQPIRSIECELKQYFDSELREFRTPTRWMGSSFQHLVWEELRKIPYGETRTYCDLAAAVGKPSAVGAVARANGASRLTIIVPCHRVIATNGDLKGYGGGPIRKQWLIDHEKRGK